jgi:serine/threonine protein kinase
METQAACHDGEGLHLTSTTYAKHDWALFPADVKAEPGRRAGRKNGVLAQGGYARVYRFGVAKRGRAEEEGAGGGEGSPAAVFDGESVVVKRFHPGGRGAGLPVSAIREVSSLAEMGGRGGRGGAGLSTGPPPLLAAFVLKGRLHAVLPPGDADLGTVLDRIGGWRRAGEGAGADALWPPGGPAGRELFTDEDAAALGAGLASCLCAAQEGGYIHCDVKPGNILLHTGGVAGAGACPSLALADWGMAEDIQGGRGVVDGRVEASAAGALVEAAAAGNGARSPPRPEPHIGWCGDDEAQVKRGGRWAGGRYPGVISVAYRPPELLMGGEERGGGVDVWAAGATLAELLRGAVGVEGGVGPLFAARGELLVLSAQARLLGPHASPVMPHAEALLPHMAAQAGGCLWCAPVLPPGAFTPPVTRLNRDAPPPGLPPWVAPSTLAASCASSTAPAFHAAAILGLAGWAGMLASPTPPSPRLVALLDATLRCLAYDPGRRLTPRALAAHPALIGAWDAPQWPARLTRLATVLTAPPAVARPAARSARRVSRGDVEEDDPDEGTSPPGPSFLDLLRDDDDEL